MTELSVQEGGNKWVRYILTSCFAATLILTIVFNALAGAGSDPFENNTGDVSDVYKTDITPAGYTFSIWGVIYILICFNAIYAVSILFRKVGYEPVWQRGGAVSNMFLLFITLNLVLNVSWLFAWDRGNMIAASVLLLLIMISNTTALSFSLYSFMKAAPLLLETSKKDFWMGIVFVNGHAVYDMWTTIAAILNLVIMIDDVSDIDMVQVCIGALAFLLIAMIIYFILEQTLLKDIANPIITHYIVYLWASIGVFVENKDADSAIYGLIIANIAAACLMLLIRPVFMAFRNFNNSVYRKND